MSIIPIREYPDFFHEVTLGPFDAADFTAGHGLDDDLDTSISSSFSDHQQTSLQTSQHSSNVGWTDNLSSSQSSQVSINAYASILHPLRDIYLDAASMVADIISSDNMNRLRLMWVANGQSPKIAYRNQQFLTDKTNNVGDETLSSYSSSSQGEGGDPFVAHWARQLPILRDVNGKAKNRVPALGRLLIVAEEAPDALANLVITIGYRTRAT